MPESCPNCGSGDGEHRDLRACIVNLRSAIVGIISVLDAQATVNRDLAETVKDISAALRYTRRIE